MTKLSKREKYLVIGALVFASVALFVYFYYFPLKNEIKELERKSEEVSLELDEARSLAIKIDNTKKQIEDLQIEASKNTFLMDTIDEPELLDYVCNNTSYGDGSSKVSNLTAVTYDTVLDNELYYSKDIELGFDTDYASLKNVLKTFEVGEKYSSLPYIYIKKAEQTESSSANQGPNNPGDENESPAQPPTTVNQNNYPLTVNCQLRFYGESSLWDGSGEYTFMEGGNFEKTDLFK